ncbi:MFS transporter [Colwellia sp. E2M01]|uniref:MFS transporter n=1 Tax=Colwellia sp. E2M01 TaxID=2841561 RepID=UPI001C099221|nr:MFS transporter [Colwellia sp. E2M01]MBU2870635.1 MFS transporter [Colwellia sp. E2M01]
MNNLKATGRYTLLCIACLIIMVGALVAPGLVTISSALGVADNAILLVTLPAFGAVIFAPIAGKLIDKYGAYKSLLVGLFLYGFLGSSVYWLYGPTLVFANRILLGGVTSIIMASSTLLISQWYFGEDRLKMIAQQGMAIELGGVIFLFFGGFFAVQHWALPLSLYLIAWLFLLMLLLFVPRNSPIKQQESISNETNGVDNGFTLKSVYMIAVLSMTAFFSTFVLLPTTMHKQAYSEDNIGLLLAFISLIAVVAANFMPKVIKLFGEQKVLAIAFTSYAISSVFFLQAGTSFLVIGAIFCGVGFGFSIPLLNHMTVERSNEKVRGRNLSYFTMAVFSGQFLTSFIEHIPGDEENVFILCIACCLLITMALLIKHLNSHKTLTQK